MDAEDITYSYESISPTSFWEERHERYHQIKNSNEFYKGLNYLERKTVIKLVQRALQISLETVDDWLPDSFVLDDTGQIIGVNIKILATDLEKEVNDEMLLTSKRVQEIVEELAPDIKALKEDE